MEESKVAELAAEPPEVHEQRAKAEAQAAALEDVIRIFRGFAAIESGMYDDELAGSSLSIQELWAMTNVCTITAVGPSSSTSVLDQTPPRSRSTRPAFRASDVEGGLGSSAFGQRASSNPGGARISNNAPTSQSTSAKAAPSSLFRDLGSTSLDVPPSDTSSGLFGGQSHQASARPVFNTGLFAPGGPHFHSHANSSRNLSDGLGSQSSHEPAKLDFGPGRFGSNTTQRPSSGGSLFGKSQ